MADALEVSVAIVEKVQKLEVVMVEEALFSFLCRLRGAGSGGARGIR